MLQPAELVGHAAGAASGMRIAQYPRKMHLVEMTTLSETRIIMLFMLNKCESWLIFHPAAIFKGENIWIGQNNFHVYKIYL